MRDLDRKALMILLQQHLDAISGTDIAHARHSEGGIQLAKKIVNLKNAAEWLLHDLSAAREQSRQPQEGAGQGEAVAWTNERQLLSLRISPKERAAMWGLQNGTINVPLYTTPPPAQAELDRLRDRVAALEGVARELRDRLMAFVGAVAEITDCSADVEAVERAEALLDGAALNPQTGEAG